MTKHKMPTKLADLRPAPYNPRSITPEARNALDKCMQEFGDISGIVFNLRTRHLITGHQRSNLLPSDARLIRTDFHTDVVGTVGYGYAEIHGTRWPVRFVDWPETREKAANVAANSMMLSGQFTSGLYRDFSFFLLDTNMCFFYNAPRQSGKAVWNTTFYSKTAPPMDRSPPPVNGKACS